LSIASAGVATGINWSAKVAANAELVAVEVDFIGPFMALIAEAAKDASAQCRRTAPGTRCWPCDGG
jgi:hypothetical protein